MLARSLGYLSVASGFVCLSVAACSSDSGAPPGSAGANGAGVSGSTNGGALGSGGASSGAPGAGGLSTGGATTTGGLSSGGASLGGSGGAAPGGASGGSPTNGGAVGTGGTNSGGAGGAAGSSAGGPASGGGGGGPNTGCKAFPVCDDFEAQGAPASPPWMVQLGYGNSGSAADVALDATQAHSPTHSLKFSGTTNPRFITTGTGVVAGPFYVRAFVRLGQALGQGHITLIAAADAAGKEARVGGQAGFLHANLSEGDGLSPNPFVMPCATCLAPAANQWLCLEAMFDVAGGKLSAWVDGQQAVNVDDPSDFHTASTWPGAITTLKFGYQSFGGDNATVHYDDVAIGSARIGCN